MKVGFTHVARLLSILPIDKITGASGIEVIYPGVAKYKELNIPGTAALSGGRVAALSS